MLSLSHFLILGAVLFAISIVGIFLNRKNVIILLMAIELMLLAVNMNFVAFSHFLGEISGQVLCFSFSPSRLPNPRSGSPSWWCCFVTCAPSTWTI